MIYLDYQATTPLAPEALDAMLPWLGGPDSDGFGNPHSSHRLGRVAEAAVEVSREEVAALFPAGGTVVFTGSATEALNLALRGCEPVRAGKPIAVSAIEHSAVLNTAKALQPDCTVLPVDADGLVDPQVPLPEGLGVLAVMQVNNEIGTVQPIADLAERARAMGALVVCDAVQAAGKMEIAEADLIAITGHKFYGPKGVGALWIRDGVELAPYLTGGGQEAGIRTHLFVQSVNRRIVCRDEAGNGLLGCVHVPRHRNSYRGPDSGGLQQVDGESRSECHRPGGALNRRTDAI